MGATPASTAAAAGAAVHAAQGRMRLDDLAALLDQPSGLPLGKAPNCAPADGLYLQEVLYGNPSCGNICGINQAEHTPIRAHE